MAQPTITGMTLNAGSGGSDLAVDVVDSKLWQAILVGFSTADGAASVVMADTGLPVVLQTGHADIKVTLDSEAVVLGAGSAAIGKLAANTGVDIGDVDILSLPADTFAADAEGGGSSTKGVMVQGEYSTSRRNITVDQQGHLQIDVLTVPTTTVTGTITANLSATDNAVLDAIAASVAGTLTVGSHAVTNTVLSVVGGGTEAAAQRVTIANDSTGLISVDDNSGSLTVDTTGTSGLEVVQGTAADLNVTEASASAIKTAVELLDNVVVVLGTATYTEATTSGAVVGAVRNDDLATLANTDNEIAPLQVNSAGALYTEPAHQVDYVFDAGAKCQIKRASGLAATGTVAMVSAVPTKKIRCLALMLLATSATVTNVYVANEDNNILGDASNPIPLAVDADGDNSAGFVMPWNPGGWFETDTVNEALNVVLSAAQDVIYAITYIEVA